MTNRLSPKKIKELMVKFAKEHGYAEYNIDQINILLDAQIEALPKEMKLISEVEKQKYCDDCFEKNSKCIDFDCEPWRNAQLAADQLVQDKRVAELETRIKELVGLCEQCLEGARYGDFSNGITASGVDEGAVIASNYFNKIQQELKALQEGMKG